MFLCKRLWKNFEREHDQFTFLLKDLLKTQGVSNPQQTIIKPQAKPSDKDWKFHFALLDQKVENAKKQPVAHLPFYRSSDLRSLKRKNHQERPKKERPKMRRKQNHQKCGQNQVDLTNLLGSNAEEALRFFSF